VTGGANGDRRLIRRTGGVLAVCAAAALALAAVGLRAAAGSALHGSGANGGVSFALGTLFAIGALVAATKYRTHVRSTQVRAAAVDRLRTATVAVLFVAAVLVPAALITLRHGVTSGTGKPGAYPSVPGRDSGAPSRPALVEPTSPGRGNGLHLNLGVLMLIVAALIAAATIAAVLFVAARLLRNTPAPQAVSLAHPPESGAEDEALADALLAGRSALEGDDARAAIIACYAAMEDSLGQAGVARERADSPTDLLRRAVARDAVDRSAATALTDLFREARFSTHPMDAGHLAAASRALDAITASITEAQARRQAAGETAPTGTVATSAGTTHTAATNAVATNTVATNTVATRAGDTS
jgi:Domain of unknown function (DUF4129)